MRHDYISYQARQVPLTANGLQSRNDRVTRRSQVLRSRGKRSKRAVCSHPSDASSVNILDRRAARERHGGHKFVVQQVERQRDAGFALVLRSSAARPYVGILAHRKPPNGHSPDPAVVRPDSKSLENI